MERFFKHPWIIVGVIALITAFFAVQLPRAELDNNNMRFIPANDPARLTSKYIDDTFGSQLIIMVGLERKWGTVIDSEFIRQVINYTERVGELPVVDEVTSLVSTDYITSSGDSILVEPLISAEFEGTESELALLRERLLSWEMYDRALVSDDLEATQLVVSLNVSSDNAGNPETVEGFRQIRAIAEDVFGSDTIVYVTGLPVFSATINDAVQADLLLLIPLVILVVLTVLFFSFRRLIGIVLPLLTVVIAVIWSIGAMPLLGVKLSILSTVLPVILVAVGSAYGIHVITHYIEEREKGRLLTISEHRELIFSVLRKIRLPVLLAGLTTFVGFSSFCFTQVLPIREFGYFSSFGVVVALLVALTLIPALLLIRGPKPLSPVRGSVFAGQTSAGADTQLSVHHAAPASGDRLSAAIADAFCAIARKKRFVLLAAALLILFSLKGVSYLVTDNVLVEYFKDTTDISRSDSFIRTRFGGSKVVSVVVSSAIPGEVLRPDVLVAMDGLSAYLNANVPEVGKVTSFTDLIKRINQVYNADEDASGIKQAPVSASDSPKAADEPFGFGDFGFGDFGFEDDSAELSPEPDPVAVRPAAPALDAAALVAMLDSSLKTLNPGDAGVQGLLRSLRRSVNYQGAAYYEIPADPLRYGKKTPAELQQLISNYLVLLSGDLSSFADDPLEPTAIRMNVQLRTVGQIDTDRAMEAMQSYIAAKFPPDVQVTVGGTALVEAALNHLVVRSQLTSVIISLVMVFLIMAFSYRSAIAGLLAVVPLSISILLNFAIMGLAGIKLNIGTALVASVSVGIGIDYTIHYLAAYRHEWQAAGGRGDFLRATFATSGKAILINAVSVGAGFAVLMLSKFNILADLGLLIACTMGSSALVSLTVLPVLLKFTNPAFIRKEKI